MASLYITEYPAAGVWHGTGVPVAYGAPITTQKISFTGTAGVSSAFNTNTILIRVSNDATGPASILVSNTGSLATTGDARMFTNAVEYFAVKGGQFISAIVNT
jgi:hypothetical protein